MEHIDSLVDPACVRDDGTRTIDVVIDSPEAVGYERTDENRSEDSSGDVH